MKARFLVTVLGGFGLFLCVLGFFAAVSPAYGGCSGCDGTCSSHVPDENNNCLGTCPLELIVCRAECGCIAAHTGAACICAM